jgi:uncharacterized protein YutE (UPF0331/DUF86 family)
MVDQRILKKKIIRINESMQIITGYLNLSYEEFMNDRIAQNVIEYNLFIIINQMIDMANHIVVDNGYGSIETLSDGFKLLNKKGYISNKDLDTYIKMVGFRNVIAHQYIDLNKDIVYEVLHHKLNDLIKFIKVMDEKFI